jgi:hypothetical protein
MLVKINFNTRTISIESAELHLTKMDARDDANDRHGLNDAMAAIIAGLEACESSDSCGSCESCDETKVGEVGEQVNAPEVVITMTKEAVVAALRDLIDEQPKWGSRTQAAIGKKLQASGFDISELDARLNDAEATGMVFSRVRRNGDYVFSLND